MGKYIKGLTHLIDKKEMIKRFLICIVICLQASFLYAGESSLQIEPVKNGYADLTGIDFDKLTDVELKGKWEFYWKKHLTPEMFKKDSSHYNKIYLNYPLRWTGQKIDNVELTPFSYATYRLKIKLPRMNKKYGLLVQEVPSAYTVFVNGRQYHSRGKVGDLQSKTVPGGGNTYITFDPAKPETEIVIQTANFVHREGGTWQAPRIGYHDQFATVIKKEGYIELFVVGGIIIMAFYHFALFGFRTKNYSPLFFGLYCLLLGARTIATGDDVFIYTLIPGCSYELEKIIEYIGIYLSLPMVVAFSRALYPKDVPKLILQITCVIGGVFSGIALFADLKTLTGTVEYFQISTIITAFALMISFTRALIKKREDILIFIFGMFLFIGSAVIDLLRQATQLFDLPKLTHFGLFCFVLIQSVLLSKRFSRAFQQVESDEKKIRKMHKELKENERSRTLFFHNTSHELRTPLNGIIGYVELFVTQSYGKLNKKMMLQFYKMCNLAKSLKNQVNTILDLAKSQKGELNLTNSRIDLEEIFNEIKVLAEGLVFQKKNLQFKTEKLFDDSQKFFINDNEKIKTVIRNVLSNALKFKSKEKFNYVSLTMDRNETNLIIVIEDTGIGINEEHLGIIFNEFEQVEKSTRRVYEGTGLGLAMVNRIVKIMDGDIKVKSTPGQGTKFEITIPEQKNVEVVDVDESGIKYEQYKALDEIDDQVEDFDVNEAPIFERDEPYTILIVDDNHVNLEVVDQHLCSYGYNVLLADGGQAALDMVAKSIPDLILLDLMMPEVSGEDVLQVLKESDEYKEIPVIILTARASQEDMIFGLNLGADDYLSKPINHEELVLRIKNLLSRVESAKIAEIITQQEKMANIGEVFSELSHEIRALNQLEEKDMEVEKEKALKLLGRYKLSEPSWSNYKEAIFEDDVDDEQMNSRENIFKFDKSDSNYAERMKISNLIKRTNVSNLDLVKINDSLSSLDGDELVRFENLLGMIGFIAKMDVNTQKSFKVVSSVLNYAKDDASADRANLKSILTNCLSLMSRRILKNKVTVQSDIIDNIMIKARNSDVHQVVLNILSNALDALERKSGGERKINISSPMKSSGDCQELVIENTGPKIEKDNCLKIFERDYTTKDDDRKGLGLYICKKLVERNDGVITVASNDDITSFELEFKKE